MGVQIFFLYIFNSFGYFHRSRIDRYGSSILKFWGTATLFPIEAISLYIPINSTQAFKFLRILINTCDNNYSWHFWMFIMHPDHCIIDRFNPHNPVESVWLSPFHRWGLWGTQALFQGPTAKRWQSEDLTPEPRLSTALTCHPSGCVQLWGLLQISGRWTGSDPVLLVEPVASSVRAQVPVTCSLPTKLCPLSTACDDSHAQSWFCRVQEELLYNEL